jgi:hypothetical protein
MAQIYLGNGLRLNKNEIKHLRRMKMSKVIIELEFNDKPNDADVYNYLNELMDNDCLSYEIKETKDVR